MVALSSLSGDETAEKIVDEKKIFFPKEKEIETYTKMIK